MGAAATVRGFIRIDDLQLLTGHHEILGATWDGAGVNFALFSDNAERVEVCLFSESGKREIARLTLLENTDGVWHGYVPGLLPGTQYGYRVHGPYEPENGHRFNPYKLLVDPYAKMLRGPLRWSQAHYGYRHGSARRDLSFDRRDNARGMPKCVVVDPAFTWGGDRPPRVPWNDTVIYEAHVRGLTRLHPEVSESRRGTFAGLSAPCIVAHLKSLGVTAVELMPIHAFVDDPFLASKGLRNYWGYSTLGFFAPEPRYLAGGGLAEFRTMVRCLHDAGLEVILDVVYNHTAEGDQMGPTLSFRGIDNRAYYRLQADRRYYTDHTGCGNTVNLGHPRVLQLVMDSLRYWVNEMHVDGFRFDLASTLARAGDGFDPRAAFLKAVRQDPVLSRVKLIAEPWDVGPGGYRLGGVPSGWSEWNDRYRDTVRRFWRGDPGMLPELARRLHGSSDLFESSGRRPWASINFVTSHDGFCLIDLVSYRDRHNEANLEDNRDGHQDNISDNHGVEGRTDDPGVRSARDRHRRNLLATLMLSQGTPMILAGDELGRTQGGNNNAYCQDNETSWLLWNGADVLDAAFLAFVKELLRFRRQHPVLRRARHLHGAEVSPATGFLEIQWLGPDGNTMSQEDWARPDLRVLGWLLSGDAGQEGRDNPDDTLFIAFNAGLESVQVRLPEAPNARAWRRVLTTASESEPPVSALPGDFATVTDRSVDVFVLEFGDDPAQPA